MKRSHISKKEVEHIAWLARIDLSKQEQAVLTTQLNEILNYFKKIDMVDTEAIPPTSHVLDLTNIYREDLVKSPLPVEDALKNASMKEGQFFKAPRVV